MALLLLLFPACAIERRLEIEAEDPDADLYLDGRFVGRGRAETYLPAEGTRRFEAVADGRISGLTIRRLEGPDTWEFPLDLVFEALFPVPRRWVEHVRIDPLPPDLPRDDEESDERRAATLRRLRKLVHEDPRER